MKNESNSNSICSYICTEYIVNGGNRLTIEDLSLRQLQTEAARALNCMQATNNNIHQFNKKAHHNSQLWYKAVIEWYVNTYGDLPSKVGPGKDIKLILK